MLNNLMGNMFSDMQKNVGEIEKKLDNKVINFESNDKKIFLKISANGNLKDLTISSDLLEDKEMLEDFLIVNINNAIKIAKETKTKEMETLKAEMIPDFGDILDAFNFDDDDIEEIDDDQIQ